MLFTPDGARELALDRGNGVASVAWSTQASTCQWSWRRLLRRASEQLRRPPRSRLNAPVATAHRPRPLTRTARADWPPRRRMASPHALVGASWSRPSITRSRPRRCSLKEKKPSSGEETARFGPS